MPRGAPQGRVCIVCKERQDYAVFRRENGLVGRICLLCRKAGAHADEFTRMCVMCHIAFEARRPNARYCSATCRNKAHSREARKIRRLAKMQKALSSDAEPSRTRANLDDA